MHHEPSPVMSGSTRPLSTRTAMNRSARASLSSPAFSSTLAICPQLAVSTAAPVSRSSSTSTRAQLIASSGIWADVACVQAADVERNVVDHPVPCVQQENLEVLLFPSLVRRLLCTRRGKRKAASSRQGLAAFCSVSGAEPPLFACDGINNPVAAPRLAVRRDPALGLLHVGFNMALAGPLLDF
jgi:hypothetical protein